MPNKKKVVKAAVKNTKADLIAVLEAVIPSLPWKLQIPARAILFVLKRGAKFAKTVGAAPQSVHEYVASLFDQLLVYLEGEGQTVLAKVAGLIQRYVLTGLTDAAWDTLSELLGIPLAVGGPKAMTALAPVGDLDAELEACCAA